jgi:N-methylhydantoinase B
MEVDVESQRKQAERPAVLGVDRMSAPDPVTMQVVHSRFETLMSSMTRTLEQLVGAAVGREDGDYSTAFLDAEGHVVAFGSAVGTHLGHEIKIVPWILENFGIEDVNGGDIFLSNDPYTGGAVHSNDVGCLAPVFADGELFGWVFCDMHFPDVGGGVPGSFVPNALDVFAEAFRFPPTRIYSGGRYLADVARAFANNSRVPQMVSHNISAEVGAIHFGVRVIRDLIEQHGAAELADIIRALQDYSEAEFRARLESIPDGVYEAADYIEDGYVDDAVYRAGLRMTVAGSELLLDFRESSAAAPALLNCAASGLIGGVLGASIQQLAARIPFNAGVMRPVHIRATEGTFINARFPTPLSLATGYGAWAVQDATFAAANLALQASGDKELLEYAVGQCGGGWPCYIFTGPSNQSGAYSVFLNMDGAGEGMGALAGIDGGRGNNTCIGAAIPDVEQHEATEPFLYLTRQIWTDSGGAGEWRGGWGLRMAVTPWGELTSDQSGTFCTTRNAVPPVGIFGGYPASGVYYGPIWNDDDPQSGDVGDLVSQSLPELEDDSGRTWESLPSKAMWESKRFLRKGPSGDVFLMTIPGGGGYGDPLRREPGAVAADVREGAASPQAARGLYGVVLDDCGEPDTDATARQRRQLIQARPAGRAPGKT